MKTYMFLALLFSARALAEVKAVSMIQLMANPEKYDGQLVRFEGVINLQFEGNAVYLTKEHWRSHITSNAFWLDIGSFAKPLGIPNGRYVLVEGVFDRSERGHLGLYMGTITKIVRLGDVDFDPAEQKETKQGGAGKPATRPDSESEGGEKPQLEAEGRSK